MKIGPPSGELEPKIIVNNSPPAGRNSGRILGIGKWLKQNIFFIKFSTIVKK